MAQPPRKKLSLNCAVSEELEMMEELLVGASAVLGNGDRVMNKTDTVHVLMEMKSNELIIQIMGQSRMCCRSMRQGPTLPDGWGRLLKGKQDCLSPRSIQTFGVSGPHWKKKSCLGPHIKYIVTCNHKKIS